MEQEQTLHINYINNEKWIAGRTSAFNMEMRKLVCNDTVEKDILLNLNDVKDKSCEFFGWIYYSFINSTMYELFEKTKDCKELKSTPNSKTVAKWKTILITIENMVSYFSLIAIIEYIELLKVLKQAHDTIEHLASECFKNNNEKAPYYMALAKQLSLTAFYAIEPVRLLRGYYVFIFKFNRMFIGNDPVLNVSNKVPHSKVVSLKTQILEDEDFNHFVLEQFNTSTTFELQAGVEPISKRFCRSGLFENNIEYLYLDVQNIFGEKILKEMGERIYRIQISNKEIPSFTLDIVLLKTFKFILDKKAYEGLSDYVRWHEDVEEQYKSIYLMSIIACVPREKCFRCIDCENISSSRRFKKTYSIDFFKFYDPVQDKETSARMSYRKYSFDLVKDATVEKDIDKIDDGMFSQNIKDMMLKLEKLSTNYMPPLQLNGNIPMGPPIVQRLDFAGYSTDKDELISISSSVSKRMKQESSTDPNEMPLTQSTFSVTSTGMAPFEEHVSFEGLNSDVSKSSSDSDNSFKSEADESLKKSTHVNASQSLSSGDIYNAWNVSSSTTAIILE